MVHEAMKWPKGSAARQLLLSGQHLGQDFGGCACAQMPRLVIIISPLDRLLLLLADHSKSADVRPTQAAVAHKLNGNRQGSDYQKLQLYIFIHREICSETIWWRRSLPVLLRVMIHTEGPLSLFRIWLIGGVHIGARALLRYRHIQ